LPERQKGEKKDQGKGEKERRWRLEGVGFVHISIVPAVEERQWQLGAREET
jgi:hypothetical protein